MRQEIVEPRSPVALLTPRMERGPKLGPKIHRVLAPGDADGFLETADCLITPTEITNVCLEERIDLQRMKRLGYRQICPPGIEMMPCKVSVKRRAGRFFYQHLLALRQGLGKAPHRYQKVSVCMMSATGVLVPCDRAFQISGLVTGKAAQLGDVEPSALIFFREADLKAVSLQRSSHRNRWRNTRDLTGRFLRWKRVALSLFAKLKVRMRTPWDPNAKGGPHGCLADLLLGTVLFRPVDDYLCDLAAQYIS